MRIPAVAIAALAVASATAAAGTDAVAQERGETLRLSLAEAIAMGLANNLDVEVERFRPLIAEQAAEAAKGAYDPEFFAGAGFSAEETPIASSLQTSDQLIERTTDGAGGFRGLVPWLGASYAITLSGQRVTTNSSITSLSPELRSSLFFEANIPLLRDLVWNESWTRIFTSASLHEGAKHDFQRAVMDAVAIIEAGYWDLVAAGEQERVAAKSLETARALLEQTRTQYEVGVVSKVEVTEALAGVAERDLNLITAENRHRRAQDTLIDITHGPHLTATSALEITTTDSPQDYVVYELDVEQAMTRAFELRPELAVAHRQIEQQEVELRFAKNQRLPRVDLGLRYGFLGLAGEENPERIAFGPVPPPPIEIDSRFRDTFSSYFSGRGADQFSVRGSISIPIPNTAARHTAAIADLDLRRTRTRLRRLEQSIVFEVRDAARNLRSAQRGIDAAERRREAAAEQLRAERIRLEHGESTPFEVLQRERDLVDAESQKINSLQIYRTSVSQLDRAQGTILRTHKVVIDTVRSLHY